jgi:hypothetical protein
MAEPERKSVPLGKPLDLTDEELDALAEVTEEDIVNAKKLWRKSVDSEIADLLDAVEE